jgi:hypothetical protein|tara:strand:+ start:165 stop:380 length:216 start_codon:yes stop_codon:yes gene_type:complete
VKLEKTYEWENELLQAIKDNESVLPIIRETLMVKYGGSEKTWKNRITSIKNKYGLKKEKQNKQNRTGGYSK